MSHSPTFEQCTLSGFGRTRLLESVHSPKRSPLGLIRKYALLLLLLGVCLIPPTVLAREKMSFVIMEFPPFGSLEDGKPAGPGVDIINAICRELNAECDFEVMPNRRSKQVLEEGLVTGHFPLAWNQERDRTLYFSIPLVRTSYAFFSRKGSGLKFARLEDLQGRAVSVFGPSNTLNSLLTLQKGLKDAGLKPMNLDIHPSSDVTGLRKLSRGRTDFYYSNKDVALAGMKLYGVNDVELCGRHLDLDYFVAFRKAPDQKDLVGRFNRAALRLSEQGVISKILAHYGMDAAQLDAKTLAKYNITVAP